MKGPLIRLMGGILVPALIADPSLAAAVAEHAKSPAFALTIPARWGRITDAYGVRPESCVLSRESNTATLARDAGPKTQDPRLVVLIQDLHGHPGVQRNIAEILKHLSRHGSCVMRRASRSVDSRRTTHDSRHRVGSRHLTVLVEGASGPFDVSILRNIKPVSVRRRVIAELLEEGRLVASEVAASESEAPIHIWGVDDKDLYLRNLEALYKASTPPQRSLPPLRGEGKNWSPAPHPKHPAWQEYYALAQKRDIPLALNALAHLDLLARGIMQTMPTSPSPLPSEGEGMGEGVVALVAGGYHTKGICRILKANQVSYVVVTPAVPSLGDEHRYVAQLRRLAEEVRGQTLAFAASLVAKYFFHPTIKRQHHQLEVDVPPRANRIANNRIAVRLRRLLERFPGLESIPFTALALGVPLHAALQALGLFGSSINFPLLGIAAPLIFLGRWVQSSLFVDLHRTPLERERQREQATHFRRLFYVAYGLALWGVTSQSWNPWLALALVTPLAIGLHEWSDRLNQRGRILTLFPGVKLGFAPMSLAKARRALQEQAEQTRLAALYPVTRELALHFKKLMLLVRQMGNHPPKHMQTVCLQALEFVVDRLADVHTRFSLDIPSTLDAVFETLRKRLEVPDFVWSDDLFDQLEYYLNWWIFIPYAHQMVYVMTYRDRPASIESREVITSDRLPVGHRYVSWMLFDDGPNTIYVHDSDFIFLNARLAIQHFNSQRGVWNDWSSYWQNGILTTNDPALRAALPRIRPDMLGTPASSQELMHWILRITLEEEVGHALNRGLWIKAQEQGLPPDFWIQPGSDLESYAQQKPPEDLHDALQELSVAFRHLMFAWTKQEVLAYVIDFWRNVQRPAAHDWAHRFFFQWLGHQYGLEGSLDVMLPDLMETMATSEIRDIRLLAKNGHLANLRLPADGEDRSSSGGWWTADADILPVVSTDGTDLQIPYALDQSLSKLYARFSIEGADRESATPLGGNLTDRQTFLHRTGKYGHPGAALDIPSSLLGSDLTVKEGAPLNQFLTNLWNGRLYRAKAFQAQRLGEKIKETQSQFHITGLEQVQQEKDTMRDYVIRQAKQGHFVIEPEEQVLSVIDVAFVLHDQSASVSLRDNSYAGREPPLMSTRRNPVKMEQKLRTALTSALSAHGIDVNSSHSVQQGLLRKIHDNGFRVEVREEHDWAGEKDPLKPVLILDSTLFQDGHEGMLAGVLISEMEHLLTGQKDEVAEPIAFAKWMAQVGIQAVEDALGTFGATALISIVQTIPSMDPPTSGKPMGDAQRRDLLAWLMQPAQMKALQDSFGKLLKDRKGRTMKVLLPDGDTMKLKEVERMLSSAQPKASLSVVDLVEGEFEGQGGWSTTLMAAANEEEGRHAADLVAYLMTQARSSDFRRRIFAFSNLAGLASNPRAQPLLTPAIPVALDVLALQDRSSATAARFLSGLIKHDVDISDIARRLPALVSCLARPARSIDDQAQDAIGRDDTGWRWTLEEALAMLAKKVHSLEDQEAFNRVIPDLCHWPLLHENSVIFQSKVLRSLAEEPYARDALAKEIPTLADLMGHADWRVRILAVELAGHFEKCGVGTPQDYAVCVSAAVQHLRSPGIVSTSGAYREYIEAHLNQGIGLQEALTQRAVLLQDMNHHFTAYHASSVGDTTVTLLAIARAVAYDWAQRRGTGQPLPEDARAVLNDIFYVYTRDFEHTDAMYEVLAGMVEAGLVDPEEFDRQTRLAVTNAVTIIQNYPYQTAAINLLAQWARMQRAVDALLEELPRLLAWIDSGPPSRLDEVDVLHGYVEGRVEADQIYPKLPAITQKIHQARESGQVWAWRTMLPLAMAISSAILEDAKAFRGHKQDAPPHVLQGVANVWGFFNQGFKISEDLFPRLCELSADYPEAIPPEEVERIAFLSDVPSLIAWIGKGIAVAHRALPGTGSYTPILVEPGPSARALEVRRRTSKDEDHTRNLFAGILYLLGHITDPAQRAEARAIVAAGMGRAGLYEESDDQFWEAMEEALRKGPTNESARYSAQVHVIEQQVQTALHVWRTDPATAQWLLEEAIANTDDVLEGDRNYRHRIPEFGARAQAKVAIIEGLAQVGLYDEAMELADSIEADKVRSRARAYAIIGRFLWLADRRDKANSMFERAVAAAKVREVDHPQFDDTINPASTSVGLALVAAQMILARMPQGRIQEVLSQLPEIMANFRCDEHKHPVDFALDVAERIGIAYAQAGRYTDAFEMAKQCERIYTDSDRLWRAERGSEARTPGLVQRWNILSAIAEQQAMNGFWEAADQTAQGLPDDRRIPPMTRLAEGLAASGNFDGALKIARELRDPYLFMFVARWQRESTLLGERERARTTIEEGKAVAESFVLWPYARAQAFVAILGEQARAGDEAGVRATMLSIEQIVAMGGVVRSWQDQLWTHIIRVLTEALSPIPEQRSSPYRARPDAPGDTLQSTIADQPLALPPVGGGSTEQGEFLHATDKDEDTLTTRRSYALGRVIFRKVSGWTALPDWAVKPLTEIGIAPVAEALDPYQPVTWFKSHRNRNIWQALARVVGISVVVLSMFIVPIYFSPTFVHHVLPLVLAPDAILRKVAVIATVMSFFAGRWLSTLWDPAESIRSLLTDSHRQPALSPAPLAGRVALGVLAFPTIAAGYTTHLAVNTLFALLGAARALGARKFQPHRAANLLPAAA